MDPFTIAVSAAGLTSLVFQLFAGCIQGFILLSKAYNLGKDASTIICMLNLQEIQLTEWGRRAGLLSGDGQLDRRLNAKVVEDTLQMLRDLLTNTTQLKHRYNLDQVVDGNSEEQLLSNVESLAIAGPSQVFTGISNQTRREILHRAGLIQAHTGLRKQFLWAIMDKDKAEQLVEKIHIFVRELWFLLDTWRQDDLLKTTQSIASNMITINETFGQLRSLNEALRLTGDMGSRTDSISSFESLAVSADIKAMRVGLEEPEGKSSHPEDIAQKPKRQDLLKNVEQLSRRRFGEFKSMKNSKAMGTAGYDGKTVFVEWKELNPHQRSKILPRVENLAALLNMPKDATFRSLHCKGTIEMDGKVALVYQHPSPDVGGSPKSLRDLFSPKDGIEPPSLTVRIQLGLRIAHTIRAFHRAGWLHKDLRSENILFFPEPHSSVKAETELSNPVLAGFSFARLASPSEISEQPSENPKRDIYRHPDAMGEPSISFDAKMDIYSLGTMLVEIAEWRGLKHIVHSVVNVDDDTVPLSKIGEVKEFLLSGKGKGGTSKLRTRMGDVYNKACIMCLSGESDISRDEVDLLSYSNPGLLDFVIRELEYCKV